MLLFGGSYIHPVSFPHNRDIKELIFIKLKSYLQWMLHFKQWKDKRIEVGNYGLTNPQVAKKSQYLSLLNLFAVSSGEFFSAVSFHKNDEMKLYLKKECKVIESGN